MTEAVTPPNPAGGFPPTSSDRETKPDPTLLTIDALRREIAMLRNLVDTELDATEALNIERFHRVDALMERAEDLRREQKADTKAAVDAALDSQKEATHKMEKSISDQISSLRFNFETEVQSIRSQVNDMKDRTTILESSKQGATEQRTETRAITSNQLAIFGGVMILVVLLVNIVLFVIAQSPPMP